MEAVEESKVVEETTTAETPTVESVVRLDCSLCTAESLFDTKDLTNYLLANIKVKGKKGQLGKNIKVDCDADNVRVEYKRFMTKRYVKYLGKKFLRTKKLNSWVRLVSVSKVGYRFSYYNVDKGNEEQ
ncbi:60S ribosomal protein L22 [Trachipleistophora hominis]|uniref:Large ribosomal subunit protein eL22 n=1 Tax=Trachipleistophora hominis TaxID=72359 RepID=L7JSB0_TRAHO|nr:60S ribosomal protein L22 [Trachipleistophora hominis]